MLPLLKFVLCICVFLFPTQVCVFSPPQVCTLGEASVYVYIIFHSKVVLSIGSRSRSSLSSQFRIQAMDLFYQLQIYSQLHIFRHVLTRCLVLFLSSNSLSSWSRSFLLFCPSFRVVIMDQVKMWVIWPVITKYESMTMQHWYITQTLISEIHP